LAATSKKGFSAHQLHRELGLQYNTAWFLHHRVMKQCAVRTRTPTRQRWRIVEADETYFGKQENPQPSKARKAARTSQGRWSPWQAGRCALVEPRRFGSFLSSGHRRWLERHRNRGVTTIARERT